MPSIRADEDLLLSDMIVDLGVWESFASSENSRKQSFEGPACTEKPPLEWLVLGARRKRVGQVLAVSSHSAKVCFGSEADPFRRCN